MRFPKTFRHGGLTVDLHRDWRGAAPVQNSFLPSTAIVLLKQHAGDPSRCLVRRGEFVREGSVLGKPESTGAAERLQRGANHRVNRSVVGVVALAHGGDQLVIR